MRSRVRTFVAVELAPRLKKQVERLITRLSSQGAGVKWVETENLHITLKFLGEIDNPEVPQVCRAVAQAVAPYDPFELELEGVGAFPRLQRPRVLWVGVGRGREQLQQLQRDIEDRLYKLGYPREARPYEPHLTIGRVKRAGPEMDRLAQELERHKQFAPGAMWVEEAVVFASQLGRGGPTYTPLGHLALGKTE